MIYIFNIAIIGLVLLIAYWWANQGLFSAILHLLCVIAAGAVALGVWEPLVVGLLLRGSWFDHYAWGVILLAVFAITLFILRVAMDKLAPANVDLPHWANLVFGFPVGIAAGILTIGMVVLGCGFMQSSAEILGYRGYGRSGRSGEVVTFSPGMWLPVHYWTSEFYGWMSVSTMWTPRPLRQYYPDLHKQAFLLRDSFGQGRGQLELRPDAIQVRGLWLDQSEAAVQVEFKSTSLDFGEQLTLSASQMRLISAARAWDSAKAVHPHAWYQDRQQYLFEDVSHYITSTPGQEAAEAYLLFRLPPGFTPKFIQIRGTRFTLPAPRAMEPGMPFLTADAATAAVTDFDRAARPIPADDLKISNSIRPLQLSANRLPRTFDAEDNLLVSGHHTFTSSRDRISPKLQIKGVYESPGTRIVMLDVSRGHVTDLYDRGLRAAVNEADRLAFIDSRGNSYSPLGFIYRRPDGRTEIKLAPGDFVKTVDELPMLPSTGEHNLKLYFRVTERVKLVAFKIGDRTLGTCDLDVNPR